MQQKTLRTLICRHYEFCSLLTEQIHVSVMNCHLVYESFHTGSLSSCDTFVNKFSTSCNLRTDALCPCAGSSESLTVAIRRPSRGQDSSSSGRGVLSMSALSHCVVRVDSENSLTSLTLQDAGQVIPGGVEMLKCFSLKLYSFRRCHCGQNR